jgi:NAD(P)-dependent dehydrogenase (short-subunit alcohol dehydrogenase family)
MADLTGRTALITGAASGIGRASVRLLAEAGATVVCADRDEPGAQQTVKLIGEAGGSAYARALDVTDGAGTAEAVRETVRTHGRLDVLAAIAGIMHSSPVLETDEADLDRVLAVNFKGVLHSAREAARAMKQQGSGHHHHGLRRDRHRHERPALLQRLQSRRRPAHEDPGHRARPLRRTRQRHRPRLHTDPDDRPRRRGRPGPR